MFKRLQTLFGYDAVQDGNRRRSKVTNLHREDDVLRAVDRRKLISNTRDLVRNLSTAQWMLNKHLDYTATFSFQSRSGDAGFDDQLENLVEWWGRPLNFDWCGRFGMPQFVRLLEHSAIVDGDVFLLKIDDGRLQAITGPQVRNPRGEQVKDTDSNEWVHGVRVDTTTSRIWEYAICDCKGDLLQRVSAEHVNSHGYYTGFTQIRGVSPLASALNTFQDIYEAQAYALARAKVSQLFALKIKRAESDDLNADDSGEQTNFNFNGGPALLDLDAGDDADFMESRQPSTEFVAYLAAMTQAGLKALDIPYSFLSENYTNYSGARQALMLYQQSVNVRQYALRRLLDNLLIWRMKLWIADGVLTLPAGKSITDLRWEWIGRPIGSIDPQKEAAADIALVNAGLKSRQQIAKEKGCDWETIAGQLAYESSRMAELGLAVSASEGPIINDNPVEE